jgi:orotidine-5'-phosphate decarboxylase
MEKLILALDVANAESAKRIIEELDEQVQFYKLGLELMMSDEYFEIVKFLKNKNKKIFADLKLYDISQTMVCAVENLKKYQIDLLTIHTASSDIMRSVAQVKGEIKVVAVTVLTNLDNADLRQMGFDPKFSLEELVKNKTQMALESGLDGVVASANEAKILRQNFGNNFLIVTPGIRLQQIANDDQKRTASVAEAIKNGASHLVVGRPILQQQDIKASAKQFINAINEASRNS